MRLFETQMDLFTGQEKPTITKWMGDDIHTSALESTGPYGGTTYNAVTDSGHPLYLSLEVEEKYFERGTFKVEFHIWDDIPEEQHPKQYLPLVYKEGLPENMLSNLDYIKKEMSWNRGFNVPPDLVDDAMGKLEKILTYVKEYQRKKNELAI